MGEHRGHEVDRTLVERRTYAVGHDAVAYLEERDTERLRGVMDAVGVRTGAEQVLVQVDSGGVPVGELVRPKRDPNDETQELTPVRKLPKGTRPKSKREVRVVVAWRPGQVDDKVVNLHVAPLKHPEVTGEHMYTLEYVAAAGKALQPDPDKLKSWVALKARRLKEGHREAILVDLRTHRCGGRSCPKTDKDECVVPAAIRYLTRNGHPMDYSRFIAEGLPIGSGEVEGRIRQIVRRRLDVPGDWREDNLVLLTALLTIRHSGGWDDFWRWQDVRDKVQFQRRLLGIGLNRYRGPKEPRLVARGTESLELDGTLSHVRGRHGLSSLPTREIDAPEHARRPMPSAPSVGGAFPASSITP